jgi:ATP-binding cassette, subfamily B, bacterial MsbA
LRQLILRQNIKNASKKKKRTRVSTSLLRLNFPDGAFVKRVFSFVKPHRWSFFLGILATTCSSIIDAAIAYLIKPLLDGWLLTSHHHTTSALVIPLLILALGTMRVLSRFWGEFLMQRAGSGAIAQLRKTLFNHSMHWPLSVHQSMKSADLSTMMVHHVDQIARLATDVLVLLVRDGAMVLALLVAMLMANWQMSLVSLLVIPCSMVGMYLSSIRLKRYSKNVQSSLAHIAKQVQDAIQSLPMMRIFQALAQHQNQFFKQVQHHQKMILRVALIRSLSTALIQWLLVLPLAFCVYLILAHQGDATVGGLVAILLILTRLQRPLRNLTEINAQMQAGVAAAKTVFSAMDYPAEPKSSILNNPAKQCLPIIFDQVSFHSQTSSSHQLTNLNLEIKPGSFVAVVGPSGAGKTTFIYLLMRLLSNSKGIIQLGDQRSDMTDLNTWRAHFSWVPQYSPLLTGTVAQNIAYGFSALSGHLSEIEQAAKAACLHDTIMQLPHGYQTLLGAGGAQLSGGQVQRLAVARALMQKSPYFIFDEPTASLDAKTSAHVRQSIAKASEKRTTIMIAHHWHQMQAVDRILLFDQGKIVADGTHQQLIHTNTLYTQLYQQQTHDT